jgi:hypothetical protein
MTTLLTFVSPFRFDRGEYRSRHGVPETVAASGLEPRVRAEMLELINPMTLSCQFDSTLGGSSSWGYLTPDEIGLGGTTGVRYR